MAKEEKRKEYTEPEIKEESIEIEDIIAVSGGDGNGLFGEEEEW